MLRLKRMAVLCVVLVCVITGFLFWALRMGGQPAAVTLPAPPQSAARLEVLSTSSTPALKVTRVVDGQWLAGAAAETGIPARALQAYATAAAAASSTNPGCGIGWNTVAAIGFVESAHGTYGGGSLSAAGQATGPIVGPSLDGDGFAAIADTDAGVLDGDPRWDRAVGPMQFIPSTWQFAGRDGNGDGNADPFNIDDAAVSAATYLCGGGRDLVTDRGWADAVYAYNQSDAYVNQVRETATAYAAQAVG
ncbi:lytic transglycosylase domain-containing protein [Arthrobacter sp. S39]|uniref:lytic transglycosylase domain-containing protein n=1 Tax=Arthrobacter sp. S39 TaxID=2509720 RepID=UPI001037867C|nr:lytic transglycosylase domain-containing protein [Arthrobacter sp. S39]TAP44883.1 murein transglycosylase [Arthrobacter sp. S39]